MTPQTTLFYRFGVALFIGILIGLQREYASDVYEREQSHSETFAGVRTFALMALVGCTAAMAADLLDSGWAFVGIVAPLGALIAVGYFITAWRGSPGMTTEVAAIVAVLAGALAYWDQLALAVALGVVTYALLSLKLELHGFVERLTRDDILATLKFALITAIVLPVLPNETYGPPPFDVLNPYNIWLMVVFISGISFLGYVLMKLVNPEQGITLTGLLGGLASSTATTLSFSERSQKNQAFGQSFALAIILAWTVMFGRALVEVGAINRPLLGVVWLPMLIPAAAGVLYSAYLFFRARAAAEEKRDDEDIVLANPFELAPAIKFGLIFAAVLLISRAAQHYFGTGGVYLSSVISGLATIDAVALSMAELSGQTGGPALDTGARAIVLAAMANTVTKGGIVLATGSSTLRRWLLPGFLLILGSGIVTILFM